MIRLARLGGISPFFIVKNLDDAIEFYNASLAFDVTLRIPEPQPFFAIVARDQTQILLKEIGPDTEPQPNAKRHPWARWDAFIYLDDPDMLEKELTGRNVAIHEELKNWDDGLRGFAIEDRDGYVIFFGKPV